MCFGRKRRNFFRRKVRYSDPDLDKLRKVVRGFIADERDPVKPCRIKTNMANKSLSIP
jgi:hypothetical protein